MATKNEEVLRRPGWLKIKLNTNESYTGLKKMIREKDFNTVCEKAECPSIHECWGARRTTTFMILDAVCIGACRFYAIKTGLPNKLDLNEPERVTESVELVDLKHIIITTAACDDLGDASPNIYAKAVRKIRKRNPFTTIEVLPSDMGGGYDTLETLMVSRPNILDHNVETVRRLTPGVHVRTTYDRTLKFLRRSKELQPDILTKSNIMVGLSETIEKIYETMDDLRANDVDILTIDQYLQPSRRHLEAQKYYTPLEFGKLRKVTVNKGFRHCQAGPLVRSSYHADEQVDEVVKEKQRQGEAQLNG